MDSKKIVIIVLILIGIIFVILVARGSLTLDQPKQMDSNRAKKDQKKEIPEKWYKGLESLLGGFQQTVVLKCRSELSNSERRCEELPLGTTPVQAVEEPTIPFLRTAKLVLISGKASVLYRDNKVGGRIENPQKFDLPNLESDNPTVESVFVSEKGGVLTISCQVNTLCRVGQQ